MFHHKIPTSHCIYNNIRFKNIYINANGSHIEIESNHKFV